MLDTLVDQVTGWAKHPDKGEDANLVQLVLYIGVWVVASILWVRVIRRLAD